MKDYTAILEPDGTYHIYNRANGNEQLFLSAENYQFFLDKYLKYIYPIADTFCYCLLPNHFHFLLRIKEKRVLEENLQGLISRQFSNFLNSYSKAQNSKTIDLRKKFI